MTAILQPRTARTTTARPVAPARTNGTADATGATRQPLALDGVLGRLERAAARLPHALALPVMIAHAAVSTVAYR
ncbi:MULTISPECIES: hypothetical protein [unclassified Curtobacterium]|jgi:hypothetical protein|uniref:hypothetical protein n=1 Tax=unclassified Curtobacterium TaxID=257496 RepID=UPI002863E5A7|nr:MULTISPECIES: hypothetical protein [unclassified Curtobacterium]MDR6169973.1 hypothetical protein [Curtobacterium sp. SORGH_AS_0776]MDR6573165.1 hypothetical protein [Curtobacterium sp. 320]